MTSLGDLDDGYYSNLKGDDTTRFENQYEERLAELDEERIKTGLKREIDDEYSTRLALTEAVVCGFDQDEDAIGTQKSGFSYAFETPLIEEVDNPADLLLVQDDFESFSLQSIICEVGEPDESEWVTRVDEIHNQFQDERLREKLRSQIGATSIDSMGYALVSNSPNLRNMDANQIVNRAAPDKVSVWNCERWQRELSLETGNPGHHQLQRLLESGFDYLKVENNVEFITGYHPLFGIQEVLKTILQDELGHDENEKEFNRHTFHPLSPKQLTVKLR